MHRARRHNNYSSSGSIACYEPRLCRPDRRSFPMGGDLSELIYWPMRFLSSVMPYYGWGAMLSPRCGRCGQADCRCRVVRCARCGEVDCRCRDYCCPRCGQSECRCGYGCARDIELVVIKNECKLDYCIDLDDLDCDADSLLKVAVLRGLDKDGENNEHSIEAPEVEINRDCAKIIVKLDARTVKDTYSAPVWDAKRPIREILGYLTLTVY